MHGVMNVRLGQRNESYQISIFPSFHKIIYQNQSYHFVSSNPTVPPSYLKLEQNQGLIILNKSILFPSFYFHFLAEVDEFYTESSQLRRVEFDYTSMQIVILESCKKHYPVMSTPSICLNKLILGTTTFREGFDISRLSDSMLKELGNQIISVRKVCNHTGWYVQKTEEWKIILDNIVKTNIEELYFWNNFKTIRLEQIIHNIRYIRFESLASLYLSENQLTSLNFVQTLDCPALQNLDLAKNNFKEGKGFKKCHFPRLEYVTFYQNNIHDLGTNPNFENNCLTIYIIESQPSDPVQVQNINFIFRIKIYEEVMIPAEARINQQKILEQVKNLLNREDSSIKASSNL